MPKFRINKQSRRKTNQVRSPRARVFSCLNIIFECDLHIFPRLTPRGLILARRQLIDFFMCCLFYIFVIFFLVTIAPLKTQLSKDDKVHDKNKENVSSNNVAFVPIYDAPKTSNWMKNPDTSILKNVLKKSMTAPSSSAQSLNHNMPAYKIEVKVEPKAAPQKVKKALSMPIGQRQFEYAQAMQKRKDETARKMKEEEEKKMKFKFQANPAPKFKKSLIVYKQPSVEVKRTLKKQISMPNVSMKHKVQRENMPLVPSCGDPEYLKFMQTKREQLATKYQENCIQFKAKTALVLKKAPFQPKHNLKSTSDSKPFKLQLTDRLLQRSEYDRKLHETIEIRKKQEEVRQRQQDMEFRKLLRQKTEFRARGNPFRAHTNYH